ncbi:MAG: SDR family oxidoreductase [Pirellulaceae bacterium]
MNEVQIKPFRDRDAGYTLLTGATGLVGRYLMRDLLSAGVRLAVLVRPTRRETASQRVERILQHWESAAGHSLARPVVLEGDTTQPGMGLKEQDRHWLADHCDSIIHNAAILRFHETRRDQEPWITNLEGTRNAIAMAEQTGIRNFHQVSTAYVCGDRFGKILESDFDCQQEFRNDYERSKFEAEQLVRQSTAFDKVTIYRPVAISGDSVTGYTSSYHGIYVYLRLISLLVPQHERDANGNLYLPVQIPMTADTPRNVVTVDWVSDVFCSLFLNPEAHGRTYHLAPVQRITPRELIASLVKYYRATGVEFREEGVEADHEQPAFAQTILDNITVYQQYESTDPEFDTTNMREFAGHIPCPVIDSDSIHRYLDFGIADQWGKSRPQPIAVPDHRSLIDAIANWWQVPEKRNGSNGSCQSSRCHVRIVGPGGGDWTLVRGVHSVTVEPGLAGNGEARFSFDAKQLVQFESPAPNPSELTNLLENHRVPQQHLQQT